MKIQINKQLCCGCTACCELCPVSAISMKENKEGFLEPFINYEKCIQCGKCISVCHMTKKNKKINFEQEVYAAKHKDLKKRYESQSGGVFTCMAEYFLDNGAVIYGVEINNKLVVKYTRIESKDGLSKLKGSKYVQANIQAIYAKVLEDIQLKRKVLFGGTPCYVKGIYQFLGEKRITIENLYTYDLVCHGVPSPLIYSEYLKIIQKKYKSEISNFNFRIKNKGWHGNYESFMLKNSPKRKIFTTNYSNNYFSHYTLRKCCYSCPFTNMDRVGDITIGDYWGIENKHADFDDNTGCSLCIINSTKGKNIFNKIKKELDFILTDKKDCLQDNLRHPTKIPIDRENFWQEYKKYGYKKVAKKYLGYSNINYFTNWKIRQIYEFYGKIIKKF